MIPTMMQYTNMASMFQPSVTGEQPAARDKVGAMSLLLEVPDLNIL